MKRCLLTFGVPPARLKAVRGALRAGRARGSERERIITFDTEDQMLAREGLRLLWRERDGVREQVLLSSGDGLLRHDEQVVAIPRRDARDIVPARHRTSAAAQRLAELLGATPEGATTLMPRHWIDANCARRRVRHRAAVIELVLREGRAGPAAEPNPLRQLQLELVRGPLHALFELAQRWQSRFDLWLCSSASSARPPRSPVRPASTGRDAAGALRAFIAGTLPTLLDHADALSSVAEARGDGRSDEAEAVHQIRVMLRRLRTALQMAEHADVALEPHWAPRLAQAFRRLSAARDRDALLAWLPAALQKAGLPMPALPPAGATQRPAAGVRDASLRGTLLSLLAFAHQRRRAGSGDFAQHAGRFIRRLQARIGHDARRFMALPPDRQHALRKRVKRSRYAVEYCAEHMRAKPLGKHLRTLRAAQVALGQLQDIRVAIGLLEPRAVHDPLAAQALDWLHEQAPRAARRSARALRKIEAPPALHRKPVHDD